MYRAGGQKSHRKPRHFFETLYFAVFPKNCITELFPVRETQPWSRLKGSLMFSTFRRYDRYRRKHEALSQGEFG